MSTAENTGAQLQAPPAQRLGALAAAALLALVAGGLLAAAGPLYGLAAVGAAAVCLVAVLKPAWAITLVAFGLPLYHLATAEVLPGLRLTVLELVGGLLLVRVLFPGSRPLVPRLKEMPVQFGLLAAMVVWAVASAAMSPLGRGNLVAGLKPFSAALVFWFLTFTLGRRPGAARRLIMALVVGVVAAQAIGLSQAVTRTPLIAWRQVRVTEQRAGQTVGLQAVRVGGLMGDPNFYAYSSVAVLPMCLAGVVGGRRKWAWAAAVAVLAAALVLSYSRGAFIAAAAGAMWFVLRAGRARLPAFLLLTAGAVIGALVVPPEYVRRIAAISTGSSDLSIRWRFEAWDAAIQAVQTHPLLGVGPGNILLINPRRLHPHNTYLDVAAELGFPGLLAFLGIAALSLRDAFRAHARAQRDQKVIALAVESALVATAVFWLFFSMFPHKVPWFLMAIASASARAGPATPGTAHQSGCPPRASIS